jgi:hypothetical protein
MNRFPFNGLQPGAVLYVHHSTATQRVAEAGVVAFVHTRPHADNEVGVRLGDGRSREIVWPSRMVVHREAVGSADECWRCQGTTAPRSGTRVTS